MDDLSAYNIVHILIDKSVQQETKSVSDKKAAVFSSTTK